MSKSRTVGIDLRQVGAAQDGDAVDRRQVARAGDRRREVLQRQILDDRPDPRRGDRLRTGTWSPVPGAAGLVGAPPCRALFGHEELVERRVAVEEGRARKATRPMNFAL